MSSKKLQKIEFVCNDEQCTYPLPRTPNKKTLLTIESARKGKGLIKAKNIDDLLKKLGI